MNIAGKAPNRHTADPSGCPNDQDLLVLHNLANLHKRPRHAPDLLASMLFSALPFLVSDGPLRRSETDLRMSAIAERLRR
jgi:hypothetical protein